MPDHEKALIIWVYLSKLKNSCFLKHYISFIVWFFLVYYFYEEKNLSLPHQIMNYFSQIIWNVSINFHFLIGFVPVKRKKHVHFVGFVVLQLSDSLPVIFIVLTIINL